ncbi:hypothetical protein CRG98_035494 [Punica granatum]|uniref:Uncharacterized protein n=1 Tax=Punica granatum TaxID=22663 RepID=A0A2I0IL70_PUNGR|nr:hypothetical protein CRG98_035494 [Punica granatum]
MNRVGSDRPPEGETARKSAGPDWGCWAGMGRTSGLDLRRKRNGQRPVSRRAVGVVGNGGGDSRPWTLR